MGAVITRDQALNDRIALAHMRLGMGVSADDAWLVMRGLPTMKLRFDAHDAAARRVAGWLKQRPEIAKVLHPAFEDCPGHEHFRRDFTGAGGLFSVLFDARYTEQQTDRFVDALTLFGIGYSWGGANSLVMPYRIQGMRRNWPDAGILVRFNIGLEDTDDLIADLERGFGQLA
jgi:cystathionine beta-lyase